MAKEATGMNKSKVGVVREGKAKPMKASGAGIPGGTPPSQFTGDNQERRDSRPRNSAGANMCSRYNLRGNQKLMGERPGLVPAASQRHRDKRGGEVRQTESDSTRGEGSSPQAEAFLELFDWSPISVLI